MPAGHDVAVVGAGIVGLATALSLLELRPGLSVVVMDKEPHVACHQSGHNSGVVHSGVYYQPGSQRAVLCREGKALLETFAAEHGIELRRCGKLIVAVDPAELPRLADLHLRAEQNGIADLRLIGPDELREVEPAVSGVRALHVPGTAVVDFSTVARAYGDEARSRGATLLFGREVLGIDSRRDEVVLTTTDGDISARAAVCCAGLHADHCAAMTGDDRSARVIPFRGDYYRLSDRASPLVRALIYPVPDPTLPFLGVHLTRTVTGEVWAGPTAVLALDREGYRRRSFDRASVRETVAFPGFWRVARRHWRSGAGEVWRTMVPSAYLRQLRRYVPALASGDLLPGHSGVRAQLVDRTGNLVDDFVMTRRDRVLHVLNAPSPAATASLAIGRRLAADVLAGLGA